MGCLLSKKVKVSIENVDSGASDSIKIMKDFKIPERKTSQDMSDTHNNIVKFGVVMKKGSVLK